MYAYLLLIAALLLRPGVLPHPGWFEFSAIGASLLYFGARRRNWLETLLPLAALASTDYYLTVHVYAYSFAWRDYLVTWAWYAAALALGRILLAQRVTSLRVASAAVLGPTSFFLVSNYSVWAGSHMYAPTLGGLFTCLDAGLPFYGRDLLSTGLILTLAFGIPAVLRSFQQERAAPASLSL